MKVHNLVLVFIGLAGPLSAQPDRRTAVKRLYIANDDHTDYMWTANESRYDSAYVRMLDYYIGQIEASRHQPNDFQTRWNCDGSYWLRTYQKYRSPAQFQRLIGMIRSGHISSPLNSVVSTYGGQPTEAVLRGMFYAGRLERTYNRESAPLRFPMAVAMEDQTLPLGLASLWAGSGARYSWKGVCNCATRIGHKLRTRRHPLYRYRGLDGRDVLMKWYAIPGENTGLGGYAETRQQNKATDLIASLTKTVDDLTTLCDTVSANSTYPYNVAGAFGYGWDDLETYNAPAFGTVARQMTNPTRRVRASNEIDFFRDIEQTYPNLPARSVSLGNEWDVYPASLNETTAQVRRATEKLRTAEALATLVSLKNPAFGSDLTSAKEAAWDAYGLYWEHNWTADGPITRPERADWQIRQKNAIVSYVDTLYNRAVLGLGQQLKAGSEDRFFVFNPLSWTRTDVADLAFASPSPVTVIDLSMGREAVSQRIQKNGQSFLRIWAENVPSVGYKVFEIRPGAPTRWPDAATVTGEVIETGSYRLRLRKSGVITELTDLRTGRELARQTDGRWVNDLGTKNLDAGEPVVVENAGDTADRAVSVTLRAVSNDPVPHTVRVTLYRNSGTSTQPRIEIEDSIRANFGDLKTWAFSLNLTNPTTHHGELGAVLTAKKETRGGHYATQNARYDWLTFNHFADLNEPNYGVTIANEDCSFFRLGQSTADSLWDTSAQLNALAGGQADGPTLGIQNQHGATDFRYRFALTTHHGAFDAGVAMRFSLEHQNPLVAGRVTGSMSQYPEKTYSLLSLTNANPAGNQPGAVLLWSLKPSEEGIANGLIARFWNATNGAAAPTLRLSQPLRQAWQTSHIETNERVLKPTAKSLRLRFAPSQLNTYRLRVRQ